MRMPAAARVIAAGLALLFAALPARSADDAMAAMLDACLAPGPAALSRLAAMDAAGWRSAADDAQSRAFAVLSGDTRFPRSFDSADDARIRELRDALARPLRLSVAPGRPLADEGVAGRLAAQAAVMIEAAHPDLSGLALVTLRGRKSRIGIFCQIALADPADLSVIDEWARALELIEHTLTNDPAQSVQRRLLRAAPRAAVKVQIEVLEVGPNSMLNVNAKRAGSPVPLSVLVTTSQFPLMLR